MTPDQMLCLAILINSGILYLVSLACVARFDRQEARIDKLAQTVGKCNRT